MGRVRTAQPPRTIDTRAATNEQLRLYISQEGKRLNWQIAQLEKRGLETSSFAYQNLMDKSSNRPFLGTSKSGHMKVNLSTRGKTRSQLQQMASVIQKSVKSQTITPSGIKNYYSRVFASLRATYPDMAKFTDDELSDMFTTMGFAAAKKKLGSDRIMQMIERGNSAEDIKSYIEKTVGFETVVQAEKEYNKYRMVKDEYGNKHREYVYTSEKFKYIKKSPFDS